MITKKEFQELLLFTQNQRQLLEMIMNEQFGGLYMELIMDTVKKHKVCGHDINELLFLIQYYGIKIQMSAPLFFDYIGLKMDTGCTASYIFETHFKNK